MTGWIYLIVAILSEVCGSACLKLSNGFTKLGPSLLMIPFYLVTLFTFSQALTRIDLSVAYAVWTALGISIISVVGMTYFKEPVTGWKIACLAVVICGAVGLQLTTQHSNQP